MLNPTLTLQEAIEESLHPLHAFLSILECAQKDEDPAAIGIIGSALLAHAAQRIDNIVHTVEADLGPVHMGGVWRRQLGTAQIFHASYATAQHGADHDK